MTWEKITPGAAAILKITNAELGIKEIQVFVNTEKKSVTITVEKLDGNIRIFLEQGEKMFPGENQDRGIDPGKGGFHPRPPAQRGDKPEYVSRRGRVAARADALGGALELDEALFHDIDGVDVLVALDVNV